MKKTVTINIAGLAFTIDEDAYENLSAYLATIRGYFKHSEGQEEIMSDIESRIAEMLSDDIGEGKQVVSIAEIDQIIEIMGQPEDYIDEEMVNEKHSHQDESFSSTDQNRSTSRKRLYRDPERRVLGGVSSGIGHYLGLDPVWVRIAWIAAVLFFGSGVLIYIIFWIAMPEAKTASEKLEMKREPVNFDNIGRVVEEGIDNVKKKFDDFPNETNEELRRTGSKLGRVIEKGFNFIISIIGLIFKAFGKVFGVFIIFMGVVGSIAVLAMLFGADSVHINQAGITQGWSIYDMSGLMFGKSTYGLYSIIGVSLAIGIPFLALIYGGFRLLFRPNKKVPGLGIILTILWLIGVVISGVSAVFVTNDFQSRATDVNEKEISVNDSLIVRCAENFMFDEKHNGPNGLYFDESEGNWRLENVKVDILPSNSDQYMIRINKYARGRSYKDAFENARQLEYIYDETGQSLVLDPFLSVRKNEWRNQRVSVKVYVPRGKYIQLDKGLEQVLYDVDNIHDMYDGDMTGNLWLMNQQGALECVTCNNL